MDLMMQEMYAQSGDFREARAREKAKLCMNITLIDQLPEGLKLAIRAIIKEILGIKIELMTQ